MLSAEARVATARPSRYITQFCRHAQQTGRLRRRAHGPGGAPAAPPRVEYSEAGGGQGVITFGWGRCTLETAGETLVLRAESADEEGLRRIQDIVTANLERFGRREQLAVAWQRR